MAKKVVSSIFVLVFCFLLGSCDFNKNQPLPDAKQNFEKESYGEDSTDNLNKDTLDGWKDNYYLKYDYIHEGESSIIYEIKSGDNFLIVDEESSLTVYYTQGEGNSVDYYTLDAINKNGTKLKQENSRIKDLRSPFMNLSFVSPDFTGFANVVFEEDEEICGRPSKRYRQTALDEEGNTTDYLLVWIDNELDFAIKCTICKGDGRVTKAWEVLDFETGGIDEDLATIDLSDYDIIEKNE